CWPPKAETNDRTTCHQFPSHLPHGAHWVSRRPTLFRANTQRGCDSTAPRSEGRRCRGARGQSNNSSACARYHESRRGNRGRQDVAVSAAVDDLHGRHVAEAHRLHDSTGDTWRLSGTGTAPEPGFRYQLAATFQRIDLRDGDPAALAAVQDFAGYT